MGFRLLMMREKMIDKDVEELRYNERAKKLIGAQERWSLDDWHTTQRKSVTYQPYNVYYEALRRTLAFDSDVLEVACGIGTHSGVLIENVGSGTVTLSDISKFSLEVASKCFSATRNVKYVKADLEDLPFPDCSFDVVCCAGGLSYGDNNLVLLELYRVLRPNGRLVVVDSLDDNIIYKINRWLHFLRGDRSRMTLKFMPRAKLIDSYKAKFSESELTFIGKIYWSVPIFRLFFGEKKIKFIMESFDKKFNLERWSFKFVGVFKK